MKQKETLRVAKVLSFQHAALLLLAYFCLPPPVAVFHALSVFFVHESQWREERSDGECGPAVLTPPHAHHTLSLYCSTPVAPSFPLPLSLFLCRSSSVPLPLSPSLSPSPPPLPPSLSLALPHPTPCHPTGLTPLRRQLPFPSRFGLPAARAQRWIQRRQLFNARRLGRDAATFWRERAKSCEFHSSFSFPFPKRLQYSTVLYCTVGSSLPLPETYAPR